MMRIDLGTPPILDLHYITRNSPLVKRRPHRAVGRSSARVEGDTEGIAGGMHTASRRSPRPDIVDRLVARAHPVLRRGRGEQLPPDGDPCL